MLEFFKGQPSNPPSVNQSEANKFRKPQAVLLKQALQTSQGILEGRLDTEQLQQKRQSLYRVFFCKHFAQHRN